MPEVSESGKPDLLEASTSRFYTSVLAFTDEGRPYLSEPPHGTNRLQNLRLVLHHTGVRTLRLWNGKPVRQQLSEDFDWGHCGRPHHVCPRRLLPPRVLPH